jgi:hypothetical protein
MSIYISTKWIRMLVLLMAIAFGGYLLPDLALAQGGDKQAPAESAVPEATTAMDANTFISHLDRLREMGQVEARVATARRTGEQLVYDHSSDLDLLRNKAAAASMPADTEGMDTNMYITHLDNLRQLGFNAARLGNSH